MFYNGEGKLDRESLRFIQAPVKNFDGPRVTF